MTLRQQALPTEVAKTSSAETHTNETVLHHTADSELGLSRSESSDNGAKKETLGSTQKVDDFPDGGREAWTCVIGASAAFFCSWGWINCVGVFQDYYQRVPLADKAPSTVAWIVSFEVFFMLIGSPFVGILFDNVGPRPLLLAGTFVHVFGLMMASLSSEFYQFLLAQGITSAIGASMIFNPSMACMATWFHKKRGLAMGLTAAGSSIGGVIFPIVVSRLIPAVGFGWAMRVCAFLILGLMVFANVTVKSRIKPTKRKIKLLDFAKPWTQLPFVLVGIGTFFYIFGFFLPITYIVRDAVAHGMPLSKAQYLVSLLNAGSFAGRTVPGIIGDRFGRINTMICMCLFTTILVLAFWIPTTSTAAFEGFAVLIGVATGAGISLPPAIIAQISDIKEFGLRNGACFGVASIAALTGSPIGGALITLNSGGFLYMKIFSGCMCFGGALAFVAARFHIGGPDLRKRI